jgi:GrpB-like predicted nucleotidyltransferase (UPF0157 family)
MVGLERGKVSLESHKEEWEEKYRKEAEKLSSILGNKIKNVEHIGSTAIPEIKAKPIIDMVAVMEDLDSVNEIISTLEQNGYEHRPNDDVQNRVFLAKGPKNNRTHYLSITEENSEFLKRTTEFRDYLNENPEAARKYEKVKEELAAVHSDEREKYTEKKSKFIEEILEKIN